MIGHHRATLLAGTVLVLGAFLSLAQGPPIVFPNDGGVLDVRQFGARPDDEGDDTAAIQRALDFQPSGNRVVYLPPGVWVVRQTLKWPAGEHSGVAQKRTILQGAGCALTTLRLPDATPGFGAETPQALIWTGDRPAQRFRNAVRDLTIDVGRDNPGAIGLRFNASNQGCVRNVTIRAGEGSGQVGLDMGFTDEIGPLLVQGLEVDGFDVGILTKWMVNSVTMEHVTLRNQRRYGWWNYHQMAFVRDLRSENAVPAIFNEKDSMGSIVLVDSRIVGREAGPSTPGIHNQRGMYLRDVEVRGHAKAIDHDDKGRDKGDVGAPGLIAEDTSHADVVSLFRDVPTRTFASAGEVVRLPVKETPEVPWGDPARDWVNLTKFGADPTGRRDASPALQAAIDSGARTIYLPAGKEFQFDGEVALRGPVARIIGLEGRFFTSGKAVWRLVDGQHPRGLPDAPRVVIERCSNRSGGPEVRVRHESARTLAVRSAIGFHVEGHGSGDIFIEDLTGRLDLLRPGQSAWCRQLNTERDGTMLRNAGGKLWLLGMKTEKVGTIIETTQGGTTDASGIFVYSNAGWREGLPAFLIDNSQVVLRGVNERNFNRRPVSLWVRETHDGTTRELAERPWVFLGR